MRFQKNSRGPLPRGPFKPNIEYSMRQFESIEHCVTPVIQSLLNEGVKAEKIVIFCSRSLQHNISVHEICSW